MRKPVIVIFILLLLEVVSGCTSPVRRQLDRAEAVMESAPDSALAILDSIDTASLTRASDRALYALLLTQGRIKTYEVLTDDSLISTAVSYYEDHGPDSNLMKSLFYQGEILYNVENYARSIIPVMEAYEMATNDDNHYWIAKTSELIGFIYSLNFLYEEALKFDLEAANAYKEAGKYKNYLYSLCTYGINLGNARKTDQSFHILDSVYNLAGSINPDSTLLAFCQSAIFATSIFAKDNARVNMSLSKLKSYKTHYQFSTIDSAWEAQVRMNTGEIDFIRNYVQTTDTSNVNFYSAPAVYDTFAKYYKSIGNSPEALRYTERALESQNKAVETFMKRVLLTTQRNYLLDKNRKNQERSERLQLIYVTAIVFFIICLIFGLIIYQLRMKMKNTIIKRNMELIFSLKDEINFKSGENFELASALEDKEGKLQQLSATIEQQNMNLRQLSDSMPDKHNELEKLFKEKWIFLSKLCNQFFEKGESEIDKNILIAEIRSELAKVRSKKYIRDIEMSVNKYMDNLIKRLRSQFPLMKEEDIVFLTLLAANFSPKAVCLFIDISIHNFYTKKNRLIKKIQDSDAKDRDFFITKLIGKNSISS